MAKFMLNFSLLLNRIALGMYFLLAGAHKTFQVGIQKWYEEGFVPMKPEWLPDWFGSVYGRGLPIIELIIGGMLVIGLFGRFAGFAMFCMLVSFTIALVAAAEGDIAAGGGGPFHSNIILATIALMFVFVGPGMFSIDAILFRRKQKQEAEEQKEPERRKRDETPRRVL